MRDHFRRIFEELTALGFNVVVAHPERKHPAGAWKGLAEPTSRRVTSKDLEAGLWVMDAFPGVNLEPFLFPSSHPVHPLVVVDIDDMAWADQVLKDFGDTPYVVETRRGLHAYYRADPTRKVTSRNWLYGERSADIKAWGGGVMAPGALGVYQAHGELKPAKLPAFDYDAYERVWTDNRSKARQVARDHAKRNPKAYIHVVPGEPTTVGALELMGDIAGDTTVVHERTGKSTRMDCVPPGDKVFAFDREDSHASGQVWVAEGRRFYTDHTLGTLWRVLTGEDLEWARSWSARSGEGDGAVSGETLRGSAHVSVEGSNPEAIALPTSGWLDVPMTPGLTIIRAPHGVGKTELAKRWMDSCKTAITVANTAALAEHNAARFGIDSYQDNTSAAKVSTTINSLPKLDARPVEFFHIDEADQVHAYLHSGTMHEPVQTMHAMLDGLAQAEHALITSADLSEEDVQLYVRAFRKRTDKPIRVFVRTAEEGRRRICLVPLSRAKRDFDAAFDAVQPGDFPLALGWTARRDVANLAWGYANRRDDLRVFWVSGENSRYHETIERFRGNWTDRLTGAADFLAAADVFMFSPALQSGVSLTTTVGRVFILHTKPNFETETVAQMLMRFRNIEDPVIVWGVAKFTRKHIRSDDQYLDGVCIGLAEETDRQLAKHLPEFVGEFPECVPKDAEFSESWRITQRKLRASYADPIGRIKHVIKTHGWELIDELDSKPVKAKAFNNTRKVARDVRALEVAGVISNAKIIDDAEARRIDTSHVQRTDEAQRLERKKISEFYGLDDVTVVDVLRDDNGRFRRACRWYTWTTLIGHPALAFHDWKRSRGRQASEYQHTHQRSVMLAALKDMVSKPRDQHDLAKEVEAFVTKHGERWAVLFPSRDRPRGDVKFLNRQMRRIGGFVTRTGRMYKYEFKNVERWSEAFRARTLQQYENEKENEQWQKNIRKIRTT